MGLKKDLVILAGGLVAGACIVYGLRPGAPAVKAQVEAGIKAATQNEAQGDKKQAEADQHKAAAETIGKKIPAHDARVAVLKAQLLELPPIATQLITEQGAEIDDLKAKDAEDVARADAAQAAADEYRAGLVEARTAAQLALKHLEDQPTQAVIAAYDLAAKTYLLGYTHRLIGPLEVGVIATHEPPEQALGQVRRRRVEVLMLAVEIISAVVLALTLVVTVWIAVHSSAKKANDRVLQLIQENVTERLDNILDAINTHEKRITDAALAHAELVGLLKGRGCIPGRRDDCQGDR